MDANTIHILNQLTTDFYARCASSFSATRSHAWTGWERIARHIECLHDETPVRLLDMGCGNLRFERFLEDQCSAPFEIWAVDDCPELASDQTDVHFQELDIISSLIQDTLLEDLEVPDCNLVCAFGLFHHVPDAMLRTRLLETLVDKAKPGSRIAISLWQFEKDERMREKARVATAKALELHPSIKLDEHDWLLDWQQQKDVFRYCHSFTEEEADVLARTIAGQAELVDRFHADGKSDELNLYLVFRKSA